MVVLLWACRVFLDEPSENIADRLITAGTSGALGAGTGAIAPFALLGISKGAKGITRSLKGLRKETLPASEVNDFLLNSGILKNTPEMELQMRTLQMGSAADAQDIFKPAYRMKQVLETAQREFDNPELFYDPTGQAPSAAEILKAGRTPQAEITSKRFSDFASSVKDTQGQGLVANEFLKRNPVAQKILSVEPALEGVSKGSFEWFKTAENTLRNSLPKNLDSDRLIGRRARIMNAIKDISKTRETIHPGTTRANLDYAVGSAWDSAGAKTVMDRLKTIANLPTPERPSINSSYWLRALVDPYRRGRARELIQRGVLSEPSDTAHGVWQTLLNSVMNATRQQSNKLPFPDEGE